MNDSSSPQPQPNWLAVGLCLALIVGWFFYASARWPAPVPKSKSNPAAVTPAAAVPPAPAPILASAPVSKAAPEAHAVLENGNLRALFTSQGGGIARVDLLQHAAPSHTEPVTLNGDVPDAAPILALSGWADAPIAYAQAADAQSVTYTGALPGGLRLERRYTLAPGNRYAIDLEQRIINPTKQAVTLPAYGLEIGATLPLYGGDLPQTVSANWMGVGTDAYSRLNPAAFNFSNGYFGFGAHPARDAIATRPGNGFQGYKWAAVKNRFFALVLEPPADQPIAAVVCRPVAVAPHPLAVGLSAAAQFPPLTVAPGQTVTQTYVLYAGPKEHGRLAALGQGEERLMEFGMWGWVAVPLMSVLETMHRVIPNYGWVIVLLTLALKIIFWPLQSAANHSMKKMQALAPLQKELSAKYKEDPQRMQMELMKLYKEYGVNPVGGCLPVLIQIPIFFGFYTMLQSAVQFRHQSWLWVHDLVRPDTVAVIHGLNLPINPLPIIMAISQFAVMKLTPNAQGADNPQMKVMQFMPLLMLVLFYNFAAALALYWTVNNLVTVLQTYHNLQKPVPILQRLAGKKK